MSINPSALAPYRDAMGDPAIIDLIDTFLDTSGNLVSALYRSLAENDTKTFTRSAHTLKSNSAIFGAGLLTDLCKELEAAGKKGQINAGMYSVVDQIKAEHKQVCRELAELRKNIAGTP